jgi:hypothetical protein
MKHTQSPWHAQVDETATVRDKDGQIAIFTHMKTLSGGRRDAGEVAANCRLAATAPDLLAALQDLLAMCERQEDFNDDGDGRQFDRCYAAIAKATKG